MGEKVEVPQATLERIRAIANAVAEDANTAQLIASATLIARRQVHYGIAAARALGLIEDADEETVRLTAAGQQLCKTKAGTVEEAEYFRKVISEASVIKSVAPGLFSEHPPSRDAIATKIRRVASVSSATAHQRAGMILAWRATVLGGDASGRGKHARGMWRHIELRNYRSIEEVSVDLAPFTVLVGPNGSGKSNFADALVDAPPACTLSGRGRVSLSLRESDCPATWGAAVTRLAEGIVVAAGVMAVREYESWLLWNESLERLRAIGAPVPETLDRTAR